MRGVYIVLELRDDSSFDSLREDHQDELAEDALTLVHGVASATVYQEAMDIVDEEAGSGRRDA